MQKIGFAEALDSIVATDNRHSPEAYVFLRDVLYYTTKQQKKTKGTAGQPGSPKANSGLHYVPFFSSAPRSSLRLERQCVIATASEADGAKRDCRHPGGLFLRRLN